MEGIRVIAEQCKGCKLCVPACPFGAIEMHGKLAVINDNCTLCGACVGTCKFKAIEITVTKTAPKKDLSAYKGVWVFAEQHHGEIDPVAYELLGEARKLGADLKEEVAAVLLGNENIKENTQSLIEHGADIVYVCKDATLSNYLTEPYAEVISNLIETYKPEIFLLGATTTGRDLAARLAVMVHAGLTADCTGLDIDPEKKIIRQTRPAFGGNIMATIVTPNHRPQMSTVRPKVFKKPERDAKRKGKVIEVKAKLSEKALRVKILDIIKSTEAKVNLAEAEIIVSGGRGIGCAENFSIIKALAETIGGAVGASRATVDAGWISHYHQVGQTGKTVSPKIYIACGISGAIQHLAGMSSSDIIIAINKDPYAPIFNVATFGIVGDVLEIVPAMTKKFKELIG